MCGPSATYMYKKRHLQLEGKQGDAGIRRVYIAASALANAILEIKMIRTSHMCVCVAFQKVAQTPNRWYNATQWSNKKVFDVWVCV